MHVSESPDIHTLVAMHDGSDDSPFRLSERRKRDEDGHDPPWEGWYNGGTAERGTKRQRERETERREREEAREGEMERLRQSVTRREACCTRTHVRNDDLSSPVDATRLSSPLA